MIKKRFLAFLTALMLVFSLALPAALAEADPEGSELDGLMEMLGALLGVDMTDGEYIVEKLVSSIVAAIKEEADARGVSPEALVQEFIAGLVGEDGELDLSGLIGLIGFGSGFGDDEDAGDEGEEYSLYDAFRARNAVIDEYIKDEYRDILEPGDVQIPYHLDIENAEGDPLYDLGYFGLQNFTVDGTDLKLKNAAGAVEYLTFTADEDLNFTLVEAIRAEDGEGYADSIATLCEKHGITVESFNTNLDQKDFYETMYLFTFLRDHPEYERIEYLGEMRTVDEMETLWSRTLAGYLDF